MSFNISVNGQKQDFNINVTTKKSTKINTSNETIRNSEAASFVFNNLKNSVVIKIEESKINTTPNLIKAEKSRRGRPNTSFQKVMNYAEFLDSKISNYVTENQWVKLNKECLDAGIQPLDRNTFKRSILHLRECSMVKSDDQLKLTRIISKILKPDTRYKKSKNCNLCQNPIRRKEASQLNTPKIEKTNVDEKIDLDEVDEEMEIEAISILANLNNQK